MAVKYARRTVRKRVDTIGVEYVTLAELLADVQKAIEQWGPTAIVEEFQHEYSDSYTQGGVFQEVPESDADYDNRIATEIEWAKRQDERDVKEFARLKAKFG